MGLFPYLLISGRYRTFCFSVKHSSDFFCSGFFLFFCYDLLHVLIEMYRPINSSGYKKIARKHFNAKKQNLIPRKLCLPSYSFLFCQLQIFLGRVFLNPLTNLRENRRFYNRTMKVLYDVSGLMY